MLLYCSKHIDVSSARFLFLMQTELARNNMRFKRAKQVKRNMAIYSNSFGFRQPYQVILDGNFIQVARQNAKVLDDALPRFLDGPVRMSIETVLIFYSDYILCIR